MTEAPAELWLRPNGRTYYVTELSDEPDAVRYVRADLYEALMARLWARDVPCLEPLGTDYP